MQVLPVILAVAPLAALLLGSMPAPPRQVAHAPAVAPGALFTTADRCIACHNGLVTPSGHDVSIASEWRSSMMANSARDPYWHAGVRREVLDHPAAAAAIEHECAACHMPMARYEMKAAGGKGQVFANLPVGQAQAPYAALAADGASCSVCHQITTERLGTRDSFTAGFVVDPIKTASRRVFGPYAVDAGRARIMRSASSFTPAEAAHIRTSEICATCHTLFTHALGPTGEAMGELPEQVPYLEWRHSGYTKEKSCQDCHMPVVEEPTAITSVLGVPRPHLSRHEFRGGNFFMPRMLNRYRSELGVTATALELDATARRAIENLETESASISLEGVEVHGGRLVAEVAVRNLAGHKLPTAYPSRRAWLHVTVRDRNDRVVFESGGFSPDGRVQGNDNDADASRYEPHHAEIDSPDKVQVYESIMADAKGAVTTGLLSGVRYLKDNRILPRGFDKARADADVAVHGEAAADPDFTGGGDRVRYAVTVPAADGPFRVQAELWYQSIGFRWADNLKRVDAVEAHRFTRYYDSMASASPAVLARASLTVR